MKVRKTAEVVDTGNTAILAGDVVCHGVRSQRWRIRRDLNDHKKSDSIRPADQHSGE